MAAVPQVLGAELQGFVGREVQMVGFTEDYDDAASTAVFLTADGVTVDATLPQGSVVTQVMLICGTVQPGADGKHKISCSTLPVPVSDQLDKELLKRTVQVMRSQPEVHGDAVAAP
eukprot:TRINITY_DN56848_c0_g1_i1.p2 TRINITY_DN56848_c0_g1~~TRINITY_DN56848_c0_g1_i1.p2  ORF type:complete len:116 (+),score=46.37 TRINITY_DN56848_c0_g1_i1:93-440(+)